MIELAQLGKGDIPLRNGVFTALSNLVWLGAGASAGQYGALVHLGATIGGALGRVDKWLREDFRLPGPVALGGGVAAAIAMPAKLHTTYRPIPVWRPITILHSFSMRVSR